MGGYLSQFITQGHTNVAAATTPHRVHMIINCLRWSVTLVMRSNFSLTVRENSNAIPAPMTNAAISKAAFMDQTSIVPAG